jgi:oxygen-independent coproporphyrinogen-3 oxidase
MHRNPLEQSDLRVPRYTSYPTAPHFHQGVTAATYADWLQDLPTEAPLSLYLHIPYCHEMCWYCGCHTKATRRYAPVGDYVRVLEAEIAHVADTIGGRPAVSHVHWGGGTPTILSDDDLAALMAGLRNRFDLTVDAEIAIETDPRTLTPETTRALAAAGVTRASLGVQDCNTHVQTAINRIQPFEQTEAAVAALRTVGIDRINIDLMYGLPHQTVADVRRTVDAVLPLTPDRLAVFGYAHVPWMKSHQKMIDEAALPNAEERLQQAEAMAQALVAHGYRRIGLDHFARADDPLSVALQTGRLRRNFQGYTTDRADTLLGFGASAIGSLPQGYVQNSPDFGAYARAIGAGQLATVRGIGLSDDDRLRRAVIERLMCDMTVDLEAISAGFARDIVDFADELATLQNFADDGLVRLDGATVTLTEPGRPWLRAICAVFDRYLQQGRARHSVAV